MYVYDGSAKYIPLGAKYWVSRRLANHLLLQHYHHQSFTAVHSIYHEAFDAPRLSKATPTHFFPLFVFEIILRHSAASGIEFLTDPLWDLNQVIRAANEEIFAFGRRIMQHACSRCCHREVKPEDVVAGAGDTHDVAGANPDGQDPAMGRDPNGLELEVEKQGYVDMWVCDGITLGPVVCHPSCGAALLSH